VGCGGEPAGAAVAELGRAERELVGAPVVVQVVTVLEDHRGVEEVVAGLGCARVEQLGDAGAAGAVALDHVELELATAPVGLVGLEQLPQRFVHPDRRVPVGSPGYGAG
jgi:hypothetical protein